MKQCTAFYEQEFLDTEVHLQDEQFVRPVLSQFCRFALLSYLVPRVLRSRLARVLVFLMCVAACEHTCELAAMCVCVYACIRCLLHCRAGACFHIHVILWKWPRLCVSN